MPPCAIRCAMRGGTSGTLLPLLANIDIPVYLGCDWQNVPLHLPSTFSAWEHLNNSPCVRIGMLDEFGLTWPWESLHIEALAWFDHWLRDGIPVSSRDRRFAMSYPAMGAGTRPNPPPEATFAELALRADGVLDADEGAAGGREFMTLGAGLNRAGPSPIDPRRSSPGPAPR